MCYSTAPSTVHTEKGCRGEGEETGRQWERKKVRRNEVGGKGKKREKKKGKEKKRERLQLSTNLIPHSINEESELRKFR